MKLAFSTLGAPDWDVARVVHAAAALGLDGLEWRVIDGTLLEPSFSTKRATAIGRYVASAGLGVAAVGSGLELAAPARQRPRVISDTRRMLELAAALDAEFLRVFPGAHPPSVPAGEWLRAAVEELADDIRASGVRLAFEVHDSRDVPGIRGRSCSAFLADALAGVPEDLAGIQWDVANPYLEGEPAQATWGNVRPRLLYVHLKDMMLPRRADDATYVHVGDGQLPLRDILEWIGGASFPGWVSFEWERYWQPELDDLELALPRFTSYMRSYLAAS